MFSWWREADPSARREFVAASLGWMLDSFDVNLYALVLVSLMPALGIDRTTAGSLASLTLLAAAGGGPVFGVVADRWGRTRALMASVLLYSVFTAACGFASTAAQLAVFRIGLGLGMGGEWASGAARVSETWPDRHRAKALAFMQSSWAVGFAVAALVNYLVQTVFGLEWRWVFFVGVIPALLTWWIRRNVQEPALWRARTTGGTARSRLGLLFGFRLRVTLALSLMNACALFAYWGFNTWVPAYLSTARSAGGIGLRPSTMTLLVVANQVGTWLGYVTFGYVADAIGRRRTYVGYLLMAALFVWAFASVSGVWALLALGPVTSFFATGHFSGFGTVTAELYPTHVRATAQGFTYNVGRLASAYAPRLVGSVAQSSGYPSALLIVAAALGLGALFWLWIPETKGAQLREGPAVP
jgi:MFS family permease